MPRITDDATAHYVPTPDQIAEACREIRASWPPEVLAYRAGFRSYFQEVGGLEPVKLYGRFGSTVDASSEA
jgi:hypothetical protein